MAKINAMGSIVVSTNYRKLIGIIFYVASVYFISFILFSSKVLRKKILRNDIIFLIVMGELYLTYAVFFF